MMDWFKNLDLKKSVLVPGLLLFIILFLLNAISRNWFFRWDLTDNNMYSLSTSSESVVEQVDDLLTMKVIIPMISLESMQIIDATFKIFLRNMKLYPMAILDLNSSVPKMIKILNKKHKKPG